METWYCIQKHDASIVEVNVVRSTLHSLFIKGTAREYRQAKVTEFSSYFPTRSEAREELTKRLSRRIESLQRKLELARAELQGLS